VASWPDGIAGVVLSEMVVNIMPLLRDKRAIILFGSLDMGGAERQGLMLARYLKAQEGVKVEVWGLGPGRGPVADRCEELAIPWKSVPLHWGIRRRYFHLFRLLIRFRMASPDILISYTRVPNLASGLLWRLAGCQSMIWNQADEGLLLNRSFLHQLAVKLTPHIVVNSYAAFELFSKTFGVNSTRIRFIKNGASAGVARDTRESWRERLSAGNERLIATMLANFTVFKDHFTLLKAWRRLVEYYHKIGQPPPLLVLAGRLEETAASVIREIEVSGLSDAVRVIGYTDDSFGLLQASDLCVFSSRSECYPNAILESMQAGLPVVATDITGIRDTVGADGANWLVKPGDDEAFADAVIRLVGDSEIRMQLGELMIQRAQSEFSEQVMCRHVAAVMASALSCEAS